MHGAKVKTVIRVKVVVSLHDVNTCGRGGRVDV